MPNSKKLSELIINTVSSQEVYDYMVQHGLIDPDGDEWYLVEGGESYTHPSHPARSSGLYKITVDALGHVSDVVPVTKEDITGLGISEQGPQGEKGDTGAQGPQGETGATGATGAAGAAATINGVNALTLAAEDPIQAEQNGDTLTLKLNGDLGSTAKAYTATLTTSGWTQSGDRYYQTVAVAGVTADSQVVLVDCALDGTDLDADAAVLEAWKGPSANNVSQGAGTLTFYAYDVPTVNIPVNVGVL